MMERKKRRKVRMKRAKEGKMILTGEDIGVRKEERMNVVATA